MSTSSDALAAADAVEAEIRRLQHIYLVSQVPVITAVNLINGTLVALMFSGYASSILVAIWWGVLTVPALLQFHGWLSLRGRPVPTTVSGRTLDRANAMALFNGLVWGATSIVFYSPVVAHQMFMAVLMGGMIAGTVSVLNPIPAMCARFLVAALVPLILMLVYEGGELQLTVAIMSIIFGIALLNGSQRSYRQFAELVYSRHNLAQAQSNLVDALESTRDAFALFDRHGQLALANERFKRWFPRVSLRTAAEIQGDVHRVDGQHWVQSVMRPTSRGGFVSVHTDVTELKVREQELIEAHRTAQEANRAKSEFLANMSHELRTPLNAIIGFTDMMRLEMFGPLGSPKYKGYTADILQSATHLLSIIGDILDLSKIESSKYEIEPRRVEMAEILDWVATLCQHQPRADGRRPIQVDVAPNFGAIEADARALKQVLLNLVNNAIKFTPETGDVGMRAFINEAGEPTIVVWDTGIGIPADKIEWVRRPFHQVEGAFQRKYQGTGLGLSISDALVRLHDGRLELASEVGKGTAVTVIFPAHRHLGAAANEPQRRTGRA